MIRRRDIIEELTNRGYVAVEYISIKNGVELNGICFMNKNGICPIVYTDNIIENADSLMEAVRIVLEIYNNVDIMNFDKEDLMDLDFILGNLYIGLQKTSNEEIIKSATDFDGIEKYLYIRINKNTSFKLTHILLDNMQIDENEAWKMAESNTFAKTVIISMSEKLHELVGFEIDYMQDEKVEGMPVQYIVSNTMNFRGASAILNMEALKELAKKLNTHRFIVLPSSIHEMIVISDDGSGSIEEFNAMVQEINETQVDPEERLTDRAYIIEV